MKLRRLAIRNFGPYYDEALIEFPSDASRNVLLIYGDNMRGKTSILNAIRWCLYGVAKDRQGEPLTLLKLVNRYGQEQGQWEAVVDLDFEASGKVYKLRRVAKLRTRLARPKSNDDFTLSQFLEIQGQAVTADQVPIEIGRVCPEQISRFVLFDGELLQEYEALLIEESEQSKKIKAAIEQVLGIPAIQNGLIDCKTLLRRAQAMQAKQVKQTDSLRAQAENLEHLQAVLSQKEKEWYRLGEQERVIGGEITALDVYLASVKAAEQRAEQVRSAKAAIAAHEVAKREAEDERFSILKDAWQDVLQPMLRSRLVDLDLEAKSFNEVTERRGGLAERIKQLNALILQRICPVCEAEPSEEKRATLARSLAEAEQELKEISVDESRRNEVLQTIQDLRSVGSRDSVQRLTEVDKRVHRAEMGITEKQSLLDSLNREITSVDTGEIAQQRQLRDQKQQTLGVVRASKAAAEREISETVSKIDNLSAMLARADAGRHHKVTLEVETYRQLGDLFENGIAQFREDVRGDVEKAASEIFCRLTTEPNYSGLQINEQYGLSILDSRRHVVPLRSAGAEQIVALSLIAGLNNVSGKDTPMIMDTPLGRLDAKHRKKVLEALPDMAGQVVLLVHDAEIGVQAGLEEIAPRVASRLDIQRVSETRSRLVRRVE